LIFEVDLEAKAQHLDGHLEDESQEKDQVGPLNEEVELDIGWVAVKAEHEGVQNDADADEDRESLWLCDVQAPAVDKVILGTQLTDVVVKQLLCIINDVLHLVSLQDNIL